MAREGGPRRCAMALTLARGRGGAWRPTRTILLLLAATLWMLEPTAAATGEFAGRQSCPTHCAPSPPPQCDVLTTNLWCPALAPAPTTPSPTPPLYSDAAIMVALRRALHDLGGPWSAGLPGWNPSDPPDPCHWSGVECGEGARVTRM